MSRPRFSVNVAITVLATLVVAAAGYGGMASQVKRTAAVERPTTAPTASPSPSPIPVAVPSPASQPAGLVAIDQDMVTETVGWLLLSDCPRRAGATCRYVTAGTIDAGQTWTNPVQVGPSFSPTDGNAPRSILFLNRQDGFVYGVSGAYVTHDGGGTWQKAVLPGFVNSLAISPFTVWEIDYPCAKGTLCQYEVRSSADGGRSWSALHKLPLNFSPDLMVAFASGVILSSVPLGDIEMTVDGGTTWRDIKSACTGNPFRGYATTPDGKELWELCLGYPSATGYVTDRSLFVSEDGGKTWSTRSASQVTGSVSAWLVSNAPQIALSVGEPSTIITRDGGKTWSQVFPTNLDLAKIFTLTPTWGWAMAADRSLWETTDGGENWSQIGDLPSTLS
jgi:photosystem II stability/assembly factor-like uncharacterized protein